MLQGVVAAGIRCILVGERDQQAERGGTAVDLLAVMSIYPLACSRRPARTLPGKVRRCVGNIDAPHPSCSDWARPWREVYVFVSGRKRCYGADPGEQTAVFRQVKRLVQRGRHEVGKSSSDEIPIRG
jgi:hypothetical protein